LTTFTFLSPAAKNVSFAGNYKGHQFVERLPPSERKRFELLKPYKGGDNNIWALHHLDIERKHKRLLTVIPAIATLDIGGWGLDARNAPADTGRNDETGLCYLAKGAHPTEIHFSTKISIREEALGQRQQAWLALERLSTRAREIILSFKLQ
jgi:hypothetical protein